MTLPCLTISLQVDILSKGTPLSNHAGGKKAETKERATSLACTVSSSLHLPFAAAIPTDTAAAAARHHVEPRRGRRRTEGAGAALAATRAACGASRDLRGRQDAFCVFVFLLVSALFSQLPRMHTLYTVTPEHSFTPLQCPPPPAPKQRATHAQPPIPLPFFL